MATYKEFENYIRANLEVIDWPDAPKGYIKLTFSLPDDRSHVVMVAPRDASDSPFGETATIMAPIGKMTAKQTDAALIYCAKMMYGLVKIEETVFVQTTLLLDNIDDNEINLPMFSLAFNADLIEAEIFGEDRF